MNSYIFILFIVSGVSVYAEDLQIKLIIERNDIVNEYLMPVLNDKIFYGGIRKSYHKSDPENVTKNLGLNCVGKVAKTNKANVYYVEVDINDSEIEYNFFSRKQNNENSLFLPSVNGGKFKSEFQLMIDEHKSLGGYIGKRIVSKPGQDDVEVISNKSIAIVLERIAQQGDAPEPASPAR